MSFTIYHNPRCSKSRQTLALLTEYNIDPEVVEYLKTPLSKQELKAVAKMLKLRPIEMMRTKESIFKERGLSKESTDDELLDAIVEHPILLERPIVVRDNKKAAMGRPPENVLDLL